MTILNLTAGMGNTICSLIVISKNPKFIVYFSTVYQKDENISISISQPLDNFSSK